MAINRVEFDKWLRRVDIENKAAKLFHEIWDEYGEAEARKIFVRIATPATAKVRAEIKNDELLWLYDSMASTHPVKTALRRRGFP